MVTVVHSRDAEMVVLVERSTLVATLVSMMVSTLVAVVLPTKVRVSVVADVKVMVSTISVTWAETAEASIAMRTRNFMMSDVMKLGKAGDGYPAF